VSRLSLLRRNAQSNPPQYTKDRKQTHFWQPPWAACQATRLTTEAFHDPSKRRPPACLTFIDIPAPLLPAARHTMNAGPQNTRSATTSCQGSHFRVHPFILNQWMQPARSQAKPQALLLHYVFPRPLNPPCHSKPHPLHTPHPTRTHEHRAS